MGLFEKLIGTFSGSTASCPWCGATMHGDGERFECPNCTGGVFFMENGELVDSMHRGRGSSGRICISCENSLDGGVFTAEWEDGDNSEAYIACPHCGFHNSF